MRVIQIVCTLMLVVGCADEPDNTIRIVRDDYGVPHVYADNIYGLYYGYGYSIAQDRLFQMEMARRSTQGTVAEVLGSDYVDYDRNARSLFSPASIRSQLDGIAQEDKDIFEGYAAGINSWLTEVRRDPAKLTPKQFLDHDFKPADWTAYDVAMIFIGTMNNRYGDFNTELENAAILKVLMAEHGEKTGLKLFDLLNPRFTDNAPTTIPRDDWSRPAYDSLARTPARNLPESALATASAGSTPSGFSNVYIIGKEKVRDANAILVNGPQFGWFNPSYVYSIGLHGGGIDVVGNSPFGYPMIMFGHNESIAWGSTWGASDIVDLFEERVNPDDATQYLYNDEYIDFEVRRETLRVSDSAPVEIELHRSVHGPVIRFDDESGVAYAKKRAWDGRELETLLAWLRATWASDWKGWKAQAEKSAINVNMYYADVDGNIGYFHGGHFPRRVAGHDNRFPAIGDGSMDWQGRQPVDAANPHVLNPSSGFIANWNNKPGHGVMNPDFFFYSWSAADRVNFLNDALASKTSYSPEEAWALLESSSYADVYARYFLPAIDRAVQLSDDQDLRAANDALQQWNRASVDQDSDGYYDNDATALFRSFIAALVKRTLSDDLAGSYAFYSAIGYPTATSPTGAGTNLPAGVKTIADALNGEDSYDLFNGATPESVVQAALSDAVAATGGNKLAVAPRPFLTRNFLGIPQAADTEKMTAPVEQNRGTENNMIVLKPGAIVGWEVTPPGQDGFVGPDGKTSAHYDDQFEMYYRFGKKRTWFYDGDVEAHMASETTLNYQRD